MILWGLQAELADELERGLSLSRSSAANEGERLDDDDAISLTSSDPAAGALLGYAQEEQEMSEGDEAEAEPDQSSCPAYDELLEVMERATARLDLPWKRAKMLKNLLKTTATYPWIVWLSRRSLWSLRGHQVPSTAIPGPAGLFN